MSMNDSDPPLQGHDPALAEAAREDGRDDELAVIVRLSDADLLPKGARIVSRFGDVATVRVRRTQLAELAESDSVVAIEAARRLRRTAGAPDPRHDLGREPLGVAAHAPAAAAKSKRYQRRPAGVASTGAGVVVGALDWGVDVAHPAFRHANGSTRLLALWDQRSDDASGAGNRWGYGRIIGAAEINRALRQPDPYRALGYHPADADERDPRSGEWKGTHGTHVLDIAAGNGRGGGMVGVAPQADIIFVHLSRTTAVLGPGNVGDSATVLEALDFVFSVAGNRPCVVNMSVGAHGGPHDGTTLVEQGIDQAVWIQPARAVVNSAGNYYGARAHARGRLKTGEEAALRFVVPAHDPTDSELEVYYESVDRFTAAVIDPTGTRVAVVGPGQDSPLVVASAVIGHVYHYVRDANNGDRHIDLFLRPNAPEGVWEMRLSADVAEDGRYHAWIERDRGLRPTFVASSIDVSSTTGTICNGRYSITVGAYDPHRDHWPLGSFSSSGPTRVGMIKPEVVAPGVAINAARSAPPMGSPGPRYTSKGGTSMAAPHVTGAIALMFEAAGRPLEISETRALLFSSVDCTRLGSSDYPISDLHRRGYGYLNIAAAERAAAGWGRGDVIRAPVRRRDSTGAHSGKVEDYMRNDLAGRFTDRGGIADSHGDVKGLGETISVDDVASEMDGLRCTFVRAFTASRADGASLGFSASSLHLIEHWNGVVAEATIRGFRVPKVMLSPHPDRVGSIRRYDVRLDAQRTAIINNARQLREWLAREGSYQRNRGIWDREKLRLSDLLGRRQTAYSRLWVRQMMYNRFDVAIGLWTSHYNAQLSPATALDPNIVKSMLYQESRMGTSGAHLMPPPSDWSSADRHPLRSRFNIGQAIDSWGPQQWLMMREMAPAIFAHYGLGAFSAGRRWFSMPNSEYAAHAPFMRALREFFEHRHAGHNLMRTPGRDLHEDYGFWVRVAIRWLFEKYSTLRRPSWAEAVRAYNGGGASARRYRDAVMARVGSLAPFTESVADPAGAADEPYVLLRKPACNCQPAPLAVEADAWVAESWTGSDEQIAFRDRVLVAHLALKRARSGAPLPDLSADELKTLKNVPGTDIKALPETAAASGRLLAAANADLAKAQMAGDADALRTIRVTVTSGYRSSHLQRALWLRYFSAPGGYYDRTQKAREALADGPHSDQAVAYMLKPTSQGGFGLGGRIAAPGYRNHQAGSAVDFWQERRAGHAIRNKSDPKSRAKWRASWFHKVWLAANAETYGFKPIATEEWHWEFQGVRGATAATTSAVVRAHEADIEAWAPGDEEVTAMTADEANNAKNVAGVAELEVGEEVGDVKDPEDLQGAEDAFALDAVDADLSETMGLAVAGGEALKCVAGMADPGPARPRSAAT